MYVRPLIRHITDSNPDPDPDPDPEPDPDPDNYRGLHYCRAPVNWSP